MCVLTRFGAMRINLYCFDTFYVSFFILLVSFAVLWVSFDQGRLAEDGFVPKCQICTGVLKADVSMSVCLYVYVYV